MSLVIGKSNIPKAPYRITFNKDSNGGIGLSKKYMVCDYFKRNKDKLELLEVIKKDDETIYYCKSLDTKNGVLFDKLLYKEFSKNEKNKI